MKRLQPETLQAAKILNDKTVSYQSYMLGKNDGEPLLYAMDGLLRYAKAYKKRYDSLLSEDGVLGDSWLKAITGLRELLNGDGASAMERNITTDSKDNGVIESVFWKAIEIAGYEESDI